MMICVSGCGFWCRWEEKFLCWSVCLNGWVRKVLIFVM